MFYSSASVRNAFLSISSAAFFLVLTATVPALAEDCQTALSSSTGYTSLANATSTSKQKKVDEWDGEVIKLATSLPGVLTITSLGVKSHNTLYSAASSGTHPRIDSTKQGTGVRAWQAIVRAGNHCIQVAPPSGSSGNFTVTVAFTDVCHLGDLDDHGDSFLCASPLTVGGSSVSGAITSPSTTADGDMFSFDLSSSAMVTIQSTGSTDVTATLYDADGIELDSDDNGGSSGNFQIIKSLAAGRYYVRVEGAGTATGSYSVSATQ